MALDADGNLYFSDYNDRVRKVNAATGIITTVAGNGTNAWTGDGGPASGDGGPATSAEVRDPEGIAFDAAGNLYIAESGNSRIRKVDASTGISLHSQVTG
jgi:sugar lactone lactonase YvrE